MPPPSDSPRLEAYLERLFARKVSDRETALEVVSALTEFTAFWRIAGDTATDGFTGLDVNGPVLGTLAEVIDSSLFKRADYETGSLWVAACFSHTWRSMSRQMLREEGCVDEVDDEALEGPFFAEDYVFENGALLSSTGSEPIKTWPKKGVRMARLLGVLFRDYEEWVAKGRPLNRRSIPTKRLEALAGFELSGASTPIGRLNRFFLSETIPFSIDSVAGGGYLLQYTGSCQPDTGTIADGGDADQVSPEGSG